MPLHIQAISCSQQWNQYQRSVSYSSTSFLFTMTAIFWMAHLHSVQNRKQDTRCDCTLWQVTCMLLSGVFANSHAAKANPSPSQDVWKYYEVFQGLFSQRFSTSIFPLEHEESLQGKKKLCTSCFLPNIWQKHEIFALQEQQVNCFSCECLTLLSHLFMV